MEDSIENIFLECVWQILDVKLTEREWISGLPNGKDHATMKYTRKDYVGNCSAEPSKGWVPEGYDRIPVLILQIEHESSGQRLRRGPDGCPFPFHDVMPADWSWWTCWRMIDKRICRMQWWCNQKWDSMFFFPDYKKILADR